MNSLSNLFGIVQRLKLDWLSLLHVTLPVSLQRPVFYHFHFEIEVDRGVPPWIRRTSSLLGAFIF